jgi:preprotein translocase subunit SecG
MARFPGTFSSVVGRAQGHRQLREHTRRRATAPAASSRAQAAVLPGVPWRRRGQRDNLGRVETILSVVQVAICLILVFLVLMHSGKDSGLSGAFGVGSGTGPLGGGSLVERNLNRWTIFFGILFFVNAVLLLKRPWA